MVLLVVFMNALKYLIYKAVTNKSTSLRDNGITKV